ncbi:MAG: PDDEXK nuclease domain-containing protein [Rikenellaceae bacterium]
MGKDITKIDNTQYNTLIEQIGTLLIEGRREANRSVNNIMVQTYWGIGRYIVEFEQGGEVRAEYGKALLVQLSKDLSLRYGDGFSRSNLQSMRKLYNAYPICQTLSGKLSWSHYLEIINLNDPLEMSFYVAQCEREDWSVRELKRQKKSLLFHRLALSKDKEGVLELSRNGLEIQRAEDIIKDPYVLEFINLPQKERYLEGDIENQIIENLQSFLLEIGKGFAYIGRQYKITIGGRHFYPDLVFYHAILKCYVIIDLKRGEIDHTAIGQMNLYLNYFRREVMSEGDNEPIGIVLGADKHDVIIEYALENITNQLFVSKYQLYLPDKELLQREVRKILEQGE